MKKKLKILGAVIAVVLVLFVAALLIFPGFMIKHITNTAGPIALGVDVSLEKASFRLLQGKGELNGLMIGNPEGFNTKSLCEVGTIRLTLQPASLKTDTIIIDEIYVDSPVFTYQKSLLQSNLSALLKNLEGDDEDDKDDSKESDDGGKKVIINRIFINDPMVKLSIRGIPMGAPIPMADIELTDIGKESEGASVRGVLSLVFTSIVKSVTFIVSSPVKMVGKGGAAAVGGVKAVGGGLINITKGAAGAVMGSGEDDSE